MALFFFNPLCSFVVRDASVPGEEVIGVEHACTSASQDMQQGLPLLKVRGKLNDDKVLPSPLRGGGGVWGRMQT